MVCLTDKKVNRYFPKYHRGDKSNRACDKSIVDIGSETLYEKHPWSQGKFSNVVGYVDL